MLKKGDIVEYIPRHPSTVTPDMEGSLGIVRGFCEHNNGYMVDWVYLASARVIGNSWLEANLHKIGEVDHEAR